MVVAELNFRDYVSSEYMAIEYSDLNFYANGDLDCLLEKLTKLIEFERYDENDVIIEKLKEHKRALSAEWLEWKKEIKDFKKKHLLWKLNAEHREEMSILQEEYDKLFNMVGRLNGAIRKLEDERFYEADELTRKFKRLLLELGFQIKAKTRSAGNNNEIIYESTCSDEELKEKVENMIAKLEDEQNKTQQMLKEKYSKRDFLIDEEEFCLE